MSETLEIPYIAGDGAGEDIWNASRGVLEEAVIKAYNGNKRIAWTVLVAGQKALDRDGTLISADTMEVIRERRIALKGPLTTPVGGGFRSVNVFLRQTFNLYVCMRPVKYFDGLPSPLKKPEKVDFIIFRENMEDLYRGIEWKEGTREALEFLRFLGENLNVALPGDTGVGVKPISRTATKRFVRWVIEFAARNNRRSITVVHKGNIMKFTEGAFREWAYDVAEEFPDLLTRGDEAGKIPINDRIADNMFMQAILRPEDYDILLCPNLNGDYLSDACAALVGGLGVAPGANIGDDVAIFEPTHGSAPKYEGKDMINPTSFLLSGAMMFRYMGLDEASAALESAVQETIRSGVVTYDLARQMEGVSPVRCSVFGEQVARRIKGSD